MFLDFLIKNFHNKNYYFNFTFFIKKTMKNFFLLITLLFLKNMNKINFLFFFCLTLFFYACQDNKNQTIKRKKKKEISIKVPNFNEDSAYFFVKKQVDFGARVPNSKAHKDCANYLINELKRFDAEVIVQETNVKAYNGDNLQIKNIIGQFQIEKNNRLLLCAHWDSRPFADQDTVRKNEAILGANDGASGVGVLLEIARQLQKQNTNYGIDIIFFDAEDYGQANSADKTSWCLGSQYWSKNLHKNDYFANYGILLDMVGGKNAVFTREAISMKYAPDIMNKVWKIATEIAYSDNFSFEKTQFIGTDDHEPINILANIPCIDIVQYDEKNKSFADYWHTHQDNMNAIDKKTLKVVGQTVLHVIYKER